MVTSPKLLLGGLHKISDRSVFFTPLKKDHLDLTTLSIAPPSHRGVLQRNGLVAKAFIGVTFYDARTSAAHPSSLTSPARHMCESDATDSAEHRKLSAAKREDLWRAALVYGGLLHDKWDALATPEELAATPWPVHTEMQYAELMEELIARKACTTANTSSFCVPVLSIDEFVYKHKGVRVCLGVAWMPRYSHNLREWAATFAQSGHCVPEASLLALLHHVTTGALALRTATCTAAKKDATLSLSVTLEKVLVYRASEAEKKIAKEADPDETGEGLTFALATGAFRWRRAEPHVDESIWTNVPTRSRIRALTNHLIVPEEGQLLYCTPEDRSPRLYPTHGSAAAKQDVWTLGVVLYLLASGVAGTDHIATTSPPDRVPRLAPLRELTPLNSAALTPDSLWKRLRRELERRGYSSTIVTVVAQLLSLDPLTRPSLDTMDRMLQDLHRPTPVCRFPFALGSYDLLRMPNPTDIHLNPGARRYTMEGVCVLCKKHRGSTPLCGKDGDHAPGFSSPSWSDEELLPQLHGMDLHYITFLYPLCGSSDERRRRKQAALALRSCHDGINASSSIARDATPLLDCTMLFQVFGGFAVYERVPELNATGQVFHRVTVKEVLVPYPSQGLRRSELPLVKLTIDFSGGLPWPSCCTETLQKSGRVSRNVPFGFTGAHHDVKCFGWVLPGERFSLPNGGHWTAPHDGSFVFWFHSDLRPTDRDRYFALTSMRAATLPAKLPRTVMPDSLFRMHAGDQRHASNLLPSRIGSGNRADSRLGRGCIAHRRSCQSVTDIALPSATHEIVEADEKVRTLVTHRPLSLSAPRVQNTQEESPVHGRRRWSSAKDRVPSRHSSAFPAEVVGALEAPDEARKSPGTARAPSTLRSVGETRSSGVVLTPQLHVPDLLLDMPTPDTHASADHESPKSPGWERASDQARLSERNPTQSPVDGNTTAKRTQALAAPEKSISPAASQSLSSGQKKARKLRDATVSSEEFCGGAALQFVASAPASVGAEHPIVSTVVPAQSVLTGQSSVLGGSPRLLKLRPVSQHGAKKQSIQATASSATSMLPPIVDALPAGLGELHVCGLWLPSEAVDAAFRSLTFCILSTGEHGYMHPPVKMSARVAHAIRAPPGAEFLAFLSNQVPLFRRNHPRLERAGVSLMLPHHGFTCYAAGGTLLGVLGLRCSTKGGPDVMAGEFELMMRTSAAFRGSSAASWTVYASHLSESVGVEAHVRRAAANAVKARNDCEDEDRRASTLRHVPSLLRRASGSRNMFANTPENQTLTFTSARHLVGEFTPDESGDVLRSREGEGEAALPACWISFDGVSTALLFADAPQSVWVPYRIGG
ncbi:conserved hypothetical protein [Leishmania infantum JPCM5]|uniref:Uncharacterized protein n=2 Tax=Leishmania infantum TaxID=5671 RepID=E9AHE9_LEIIN|nr:conserved hypothetical protein [Leishmania infantum JPCM5]CAC9499161.1 hypothetical_protein_-_conserved [Leishmania infantum]CBZ08826.1 conserved hypothetical protein [Leishmania infantum JPCM5]SUZ42960.1 hypothetical_protein_-_conserved [Leishmania infantum]|eukprot:XP_003392650.1 conserved hypothetical protein [Leishmania infantum JPCM5]